MDNRPDKLRVIKADLSLLSVVIIWGTTFPLMKSILTNVSPYYLIALRFGLAWLVLTIIFRRKLGNIDLKTLGRGIILGCWLLAGYAFQVVGLQYTTASRSAFITGLSVVLVPLLAVVILKQFPPPAGWAGVILAVAGLYFLSGINNAGFYRGDILTMFCALAIAMQIILLSKYVTRNNYIVLAWVQMGIVALGGFILALYYQQIAKLKVPALMVIIYTGLFASALAYYVQSRAQRYTTPTHAALIFTLEPVFGALFSFLILGEIMGLNGIIGGLLIVAGMLMAEYGELKKRSRSK